jgi:hypothetical protein
MPPPYVPEPSRGAFDKVEWDKPRKVQVRTVDLKMELLWRKVSPTSCSCTLHICGTTWLLRASEFSWSVLYYRETPRAYVLEELKRDRAEGIDDGKKRAELYLRGHIGTLVPTRNGR